MKNGKRKILPVVLIVIALLLLAFGYMVFGFMSEFKKMKTLPTGQVAPGITAVDNQMVDFYLLKSDQGLVAIDSGAKPEMTLREMKRIGADPDKVVAVYLTHTDFDHTAGIPLFKNAKVYISRPEEGVINGKTPRSPLFTNKLKHDYGFMEDGQATNIAGFKIQAILTPGHTMGSLSFLVNGKYLFTGDTLTLRNGSVIPFPNFINMNTEMQKRSIKKLASLKGVEKVFTAHSGSTDDFDKAFKDWK